MYQLSRVCVGNYGHGEARFKSSLADFRTPEGLTAGSVMLFAPNGNGKTTFLSYMLHVFKPNKRDFVQTKQKPMHRMEAYFKEGQPGFIVMDLTVRENGLIVSDRPALVIGAITERRGDDVASRFFMIDPRQGYGFDDIEFIKPILDGERADVTKDQIDAWLSSNRSRPGFALYTGKNEWTKALESWGFNLKSFDVMVTMAEKEGGIEKFLEDSSPDAILERVFQLFSDEEAARVVVDELESFLVDHAAIPETRRIMETEMKIVDMELALHADELVRQASEQELNAARGRAAAAHAFAASRLEAIENENEEHQSAIAAAQKEMADAVVRLREARIRQEAERVIVKRNELEACETRLTILAARKKELHFERLVNACLPSANQIRSLETIREGHRMELARLRQNDLDLTIPLSKAGACLRASLQAEIRSIDDRIEARDADYVQQGALIEDYGRQLSKATSEALMRERAIDGILKARESIRSACASIEELSGTSCSQSTAAIDIRDQFRIDKEARVRSIAELETVGNGKRQQIENLNKDLASLERDLDRAHSGAAVARTKLAAFEASEKVLRADHLDHLKPGAIFDISDMGIDSELDADRDKWIQKRAEAKAETAALEKQISFLGSSGMFADEDVQRALVLCQQAGIDDISTYVSWISKNTQTGEEAREFAERNLHFALGLRVNTPRDLVRIGKAFDRAKWNLGKPVPVTVVRSIEDMERTSHSAEQFVLSSATDHAYHERTRLAELATAQLALSKAVEISTYAETCIGRIDSCRRALSDHRHKFRSDSHSLLMSACDEADQQVCAIAESLASRTEDRDQVQIEFLDNEELVAAARKEIAPFAALVAEIDVLVDQIIRNSSEARAEMSISAERDAISALRMDADGLEALRAKASSRREEIASGSTLDRRDRETFDRELNKIEFGAEIAYESALLPPAAARQQYDEQMLLYRANACTSERINELSGKIDKIEWQISEKEIQFKRDAGSNRQDPGFNSRLKDGALFSDAAIEEMQAAVERDLEQVDIDLNFLAGETGRLREASRIRDDLHELQDDVAAAIADMSDSRPVGPSALSEGDIEQAETDITRCSAIITERRNAAAQAFPVMKTLSKHVPELAIAANGAAPSDDRFDGPTMNWEEITDEIRRTVQKLAGKHKRDAGAAASRHDAIKTFLGKAENALGDNGFRDRLQSMTDATEHASHSLRYVEILRRKIEAAQDSILRSDKAQTDLVKSVTKVLDGAIRKVISASGVKVPDNSGTFSGQPLIKLPLGIDRAALNDILKESIASRYVAEQLAQPKRTPLRNSSQMAVGLLKMVAKTFDKDAFCLRILKPVDQADEASWEEIHKLTGSGGQTITAALLLVMVASNMNGESADGISAQSFMILDNPIGKANKTSLVGLQLNMAKHFGIQMIATSGIKDQYLSKYEWIVSFNVTTRYGKSKETTLRYDDNLIEGYVHRLKSPLTAKEAA